MEENRSIEDNLYADDIMHLAARMGQMILENGGETYRVEQTINMVCRAYGFANSQSFVTPTGIMLSVIHNNETKSLVKRINIRTVNLTKISLVNDLSRRIMNEKLSVSEVNRSLDEINHSKVYSEKTCYFYTALASGAFCLLFGGNVNDFFITCFVGFCMSYVNKYLYGLEVNAFFVNIIGGMIAALVGLASVKFGLAVNEDKIVIGSIMMLLPGLAITNAVRDTIAGDLVSGISRTIEAFFAAIGIAIGTGSMFNLWFTIFGGM